MTTVEAKIVNLKEVSDYIKKIPASSFTAFKQEMTSSLFEIDQKIKENATLKVRSGTLMRSITTYSKGVDFYDYKAGIYSDCVYAVTHEEGMTITAKKAYMGVPGGPFLNIPAKANKTAAGVTRMQAREVFNNGGFVMGRTVMRGGDDPMRRYDVMFYLKKSVEIPARLNMVKTTEEQVPTLLARLAQAIGQ